MRSTLAVTVAAVAAMLIQTTAVVMFPWLPVVPDLVLVLVVYLGIRHRTVGGAVGAFLLGYFLDACSGTMLGLQAFSLTVTYVGVQLVARRLWLHGGAAVVIVAFLATWIRGLAAVTLAVLLADGAQLGHYVLRYGFLEAAAAAVLAPMTFRAVDWERRMLGLW